MQGSNKSFAQIQVDEISSSSLMHQHCNPITEGHCICQAGFALSEALMDVINRLHFFHEPLHSFQKDLLHDCQAQR